jgi:hypothetical protein
MPSYHMVITLKPEDSLKSACLNKGYWPPKSSKALSAISTIVEE